MESKMRVEFEAWYQNRYGVRDMAITWEHARFCDAFEIWKESRAALVVELPDRFSEKYQDYFDDVEGGCFNEGRYISDMTAVLEAAGVKVKS